MPQELAVTFSKVESFNVPVAVDPFYDIDIELVLAAQDEVAFRNMGNAEMELA